MGKINVKKWLKYSLVLLVAWLIQSTLLNRISILGISPMLVPVCVACVAMFEGGDSGAAFGLGAGLLLALTQSDRAALYVVGLTLAGAAVGGLSTHYFTSTILSSLLMSIMALAISEGLIWLFGMAVGTLPGIALVTVLLPVIGVSFLFTPLLYFPAKAIHDR